MQDPRDEDAGRGAREAKRVKPMAPTGAAIQGTLEVIPGVALAGAFRQPDGSVDIEYVDRDGQESVFDDDETILVDEDGSYWRKSQLVPQDTAPDPDAKPAEAYSTFSNIFEWGFEKGRQAALGDTTALIHALRNRGLAGAVFSAADVPERRHRA